MSNICIFGKEIQIRDYYCQLDNMPPLKRSENMVNLYVNITNKCNAGCDFCINEHNKNNQVQFNMEKFRKVISELLSVAKINKVSFSGGEPTLNYNTLIECIKYCKTIDKNIFTVVNTNGSNLDLLNRDYEYIDSISLSRHHYNDKINREIFKTDKIPDLCKIKEFPHKEILHISCNLMRDYIGNKEEIKKFLNILSKNGCYDFGFVSLIQCNNFCRKQFVDFSDIDFDSDTDVFITKNWNYQSSCKCRNYVFINDDAETVNVYARYYMKNQQNGTQLVFDGENLKTGFAGEIIF